MKLSLTNAMVKHIVEAVKNNKLRYALGGVYNNILVITCDGAIMYRAEVNNDFIEYLNKVKQPAADYQAMTHLFESLEKYIVRSYAYDEFDEVTHRGKKFKQVTYNDNKYLFDPRYLTQFRSKKYELNLFIYGAHHGVIVHEYDTKDDIYDECAVIMGVLA